MSILPWYSPPFSFDLLVLDQCVSVIRWNLFPLLYQNLQLWHSSNVPVEVLTIVDTFTSIGISLGTWTFWKSFIQWSSLPHTSQTFKMVPIFNWRTLLLPPPEVFPLLLPPTNYPPHLFSVLGLLYLQLLLLLLLLFPYWFLLILFPTYCHIWFVNWFILFSVLQPTPLIENDCLKSMSLMTAAIVRLIW